MPEHFNQDRIIRMFAEIQDHIYNGCIKNELSQIAKHTRDPIIIEICSRVAIFLKIQIDTSFHQENPDRIRQSQQRLINHLKSPKDKFDEILKILPDYNSKWINCLFELTQEQLIYLSQEFIRLDREPDVYDRSGNEILPGDLVAHHCQDAENKEYEHYGVVMQGAKGFTVKHFFAGPTVKPKNNLVEKGIGYVHSLPYTSEWIFKEHPPKSISYQEIKERIEYSDNIQNKVWNKLSYNCEHWAREMVFGDARCTQLENMRKEIKSKKELERA